MQIFNILAVDQEEIYRWIIVQFLTCFINMQRLEQLRSFIAVAP